MIISLWIILRVKRFSDKSCREHQNNHLIFNKFFFRKSRPLEDNVRKILYNQVSYRWQYNMAYALCVLHKYRGADKSSARPGRKQANVSVIMSWISFGALPCRKKSWWQLTSRCWWNGARLWYASEFVFFLVGLRTYQHPGTATDTNAEYLKLTVFPRL